jgi:hypothetical protein
MIGEYSGGIMTTDQLVRLAETYSAHTGRTLATVGTYAGKAGHFFTGLKAGRSCTFRKAEQVALWLADSWPEDLPWPADIPRPPKAKREAA